MTLEPFIAWGLVTAIVLLVGVFVLTQARIALRRRARRRHFRNAAHATGPAPLQAAPGPAAIPPDRVATISSDAQQAAWRVAHNAEPKRANPHPARTREYVLWEATFHSALSDFSELPEVREAVAPVHDKSP